MRAVGASQRYSVLQSFVTPHKRPLSSDSSECDTPQKDKRINKKPHITNTFEEETKMMTPITKS